MHCRYIDDGFLVWTGSLERLNALRAELAAVDPVNLELTWSVSDHMAVFLDLEIFKGAGWRNTSLLDSRCFQKATNRYLYLPFSTETPRHVFMSFITGEIRRYVKRCSLIDDYVHMLELFRARLKLRGYTDSFLSFAFAAAPRYADRSHLLGASSGAAPAASARSHVLIADFSHALQRVQVARVLHECLHLLPLPLRDVPIVVAWRQPRKLAALLVSYRYPRHPLTQPDLGVTSPTPPASGTPST
jgi:hypothetical protein